MTREGQFQLNVIHGFLLLIFRTLLFPTSLTLIDAALADVVLQLVGGRSFITTLLPKTMRSLSFMKERERGTLRGCLALLQL